jgi:ribosomal protein S18 acetylase RimI-like enzyme
MPETKNLRIRDAREEDRDAMLDVTVSAYQEYAALLGEEHWQAYSQGMATTIRGDDQPERVVAEQDGAIVGSVLLYPAGTVIQTPDGGSVSRERPEVRLLAVSPAARGQGIGRALIAECARRAALAGASALTLHTTDMMQSAVHLYEGMGFERAPEIDFTPAPGVVIKGYALSLNAAPQ